MSALTAKPLIAAATALGARDKVFVTTAADGSKPLKMLTLRSERQVRRFRDKIPGEPLYLDPRDERDEIFVLVAIGKASDGEGTNLAELTPTVEFERDGKHLRCFTLDRPLHVDKLDEGSLGELGLSADTLIPFHGSDGWERVSSNPGARLSSAALLKGELKQVGPVYEPGDFINDAEVLTPFDARDPSLDGMLVISRAGNAKSYQFEPCEMSKRELIAQLTFHHDARQKDGPCFVGAALANSVRQKKAVTACYTLSLDIDTGVPRDVIVASLEAAGFFSVIHTTFSHGLAETRLDRDRVLQYGGLGLNAGDDAITETVCRYLLEEKGWYPDVVHKVKYEGVDHDQNGIQFVLSHPPLEKYRIIVPLAVPFLPGEDAPSLKEAGILFRSLIEALAERLGLSNYYDRAATDPSRLFYYPSHKKGADYFTGILGGLLLDWRDLLDDGPDPGPDPTPLAGGQPPAPAVEPRRSNQTAGGKALARWGAKAGAGFDIVGMLLDQVPDKIRSQDGTKLTIECPFDADHSNPGDPDDMGCFVANADGVHSKGFVFHCQHNNCAGHDRLDFLAKACDDGWFEPEVLASPQFVESKADVESIRLSLPRQDAGAGDTCEKLLNDVDALEPHPSSAAVKALVLRGVSLDLGPLEETQLLEKLVRATPWGKRDLKNEWRRQASAQLESSGWSDADIEAQLRLPDGSPFQLPGDRWGKLIVRSEDGRPWICRVSSDEGPTLLCTPVQIGRGIKYVDRGNTHALEINVLDSDGCWSAIELSRGDLARPQDVHRILLEAGVCISEEGKSFVVQYLSQSSRRSEIRYHRAGFRDNNVFVCPTGEVLLTNETVGLAKSACIPGEARAGSLSEWKAGAVTLFGLSSAQPLQALALYSLVGPLVDRLGQDTVVISIEGKSSSGKSSGQMLAAASWGEPKVGQGLFNLSSGTINSQESILQRGSGTLTALDEAGQLGGDLQKIVFQAQGGAGRRRLKANADERDLRCWGGQALLLSAEKGFAANLLESGTQMLGGATARLIPIITDDSPRIDDDVWKASVEVMLANYGHSGPEFVRALKALGYVDDPARLKAMVDAEVERLVQDGEQIERRAARIVAFMTVAGTIATEGGLLPEDFDVEALADWVWTGAKEANTAPRDPIERGVEALLENLVHMQGAQVQSVHDHDENRAEAWAYSDIDVPDEEKAYFIRNLFVERMADGFANGRAIRRRLQQKGLLLLEPGRGDALTWGRCPKVTRNGCYTAVRASAVDDAEV